MQTSITTNFCHLIGVQSPFIFRQLFEKESSTFSYLIADSVSREALLIDPVLETVPRDVQLIKELGLNLRYVLNTHVHADHVTGSGELKKIIGATCKSVISVQASAQADVLVKDGQILECGKIKLECRSTPGHTVGCFTYVMHETGAAFTGDALLIRSCGRTDFQGGSPEVLYESVHSKILSLPDFYMLFPAHEYAGRMMTTVEEEKQYNARLTKSKEEFVVIMNKLNLPKPNKIDFAGPLNTTCGV